MRFARSIVPGAALRVSAVLGAVLGIATSTASAQTHVLGRVFGRARTAIKQARLRFSAIAASLPAALLIGFGSLSEATAAGIMTKLTLWGKRAFGVFLVCATTAIALRAQTLTTLFRFDGTDGKNPEAALIQATDGSFYGTTTASVHGAIDPCVYSVVGCGGTVFTITPGGTLTTLYTFCSQSDCTDGANPEAALVRATNGNFYGTTAAGGANDDSCEVSGTLGGCGTVFEITASGTLATLYTFCSQSNCTDGANPLAALVQATDGNFYGTTSAGGANLSCPGQPYQNGCGTVFRITPSGSLTTLYSFCSRSNGFTCTDGAEPVAGLVQGTDGNFYGTTHSGGTGEACGAGCGTVFKITMSGTLTTLHSFDLTDGWFPCGGLVQGTDGNFYGTTLNGGANGGGTVFTITPDGTLTTLYNLDDSPFAGLVQATDGNFYGTTFLGDTVFKITPNGTLTTLYTFCLQSGCTDGENPLGALVQGTDGNLYGTMTYGGTFTGDTLTCPVGCGTVFSLSVGPLFTPSPSSLNFGTQLVSTTSGSQTLTLTNPGGAPAPLIITSVSTTGDFAQTNTCGSSVAEGASCTISVTFTPTQAGTRTGTITITDNAPGSPQIVTLTGTGTVSPVVTLSASTISLGGQVVGTTSAAHAVTLTNTGNAALNITSIAVTPAAFTETNTCGASLKAAASCTITVTFTPSVAGNIAGMLSITDNASGSPQQVTLSGVGQDFSIGPYNLSSTMPAGFTAAYDLSVSPQGGFNQTVSLACSGAPQQSSCTVTPTSTILDGRTHAVITLRVLTSAPAGLPPMDHRLLRLPPGWLLLVSGSILVLLTMLATEARRRLAPRFRLRRVLTPAGALLLFALVWVGCGGGGSFVMSPPATGGTPSGTYVVTVTAASGHLSHAVTVQLTVR